MKTFLASVLELVKRVTKLELFKYLFEFFIVFLGVYLAFVLTGYQENQRERDIRIQHYENFAVELGILVESLEEEKRKLDKHLKVVDEIAQGNRPDIPPSDLIFVYKGSLVDAAFNSRHFEALDAKIVRQIILGSFGLALLEAQVESFNEKSTALLPTLANREECCYDENGELLGHWQWYPSLVQAIYRLNRIAHDGILNRAIPDLQAHVRRIRNLPPID
ncbi:MAG: hypothetical protein F4W92_08860 [Gammaproteobacteria bacterium]|nr:hypothetical protein [Gammaproteobacteria bacterium]